MARVEQPLGTRSWTTEKTILPFLQGSYSVFAKQSQTLRDPRGDLWGVDFHCHRRRDAAGGGAVGLQALEFMEGLVKAPLYGGIVAREVGKGVLSVLASRIKAPPRPRSIPRQLNRSSYIAAFTDRTW
jgi:hypothetical protein